MKTQNPLKVAIVHDWAFVRRGGERVVEQIAFLFPGADIFLLFGNPQKAFSLQYTHHFTLSFLARIPAIEKLYKLLLPLLPLAAESFDLSNYDLVLSSSSCVAKGVIAPPRAIHVAYLHSPMRYAWDQEHVYFPRAPSFFRPIELLRRIFLSRLRVWDVTSSQRIDALIANSSFVARRCQFYYGRSASVVHPPVDLARFNTIERTNQPNRPKKALIFGAWVPYKRMGHAFEKLIQAEIPVLAAGQGEELERLAIKYAAHPLASFLINPDSQAALDMYASTDVLVFPAIEDFGIIPVEAMAAGLWVVAPNEGGTRESVISGVTGTHFPAGDDDALIRATKEALERTLSTKDLECIRSHVAKFSIEQFRHQYFETIKQCAALHPYRAAELVQSLHTLEHIRSDI